MQVGILRSPGDAASVIPDAAGSGSEIRKTDPINFKFPDSGCEPPARPE